MTTRLRSRRTSLVLVAGLALTVIPLAAPPTTAHAAAGGGCGNWVTSVNTVGNVHANSSHEACVNVDRSFEVNGDTYIYFASERSDLWTACTVTVTLWNPNTGKVYASGTGSCLGAARAGGEFYGKAQTTYLNDENRYQTIAFWRGTFGGRAVSSRIATSHLQL
jgi:hypothetical protein